MDKNMKVFKIFLRLKWQEIKEFILKCFIPAIICVFASMGVMACIMIFIGWLSDLFFGFRSHCSTYIEAGLIMVFCMLVFLCIVHILYKVSVSIAYWLSNNWQKAKIIANKEEKGLNEVLNNR